MCRWQLACELDRWPFEPGSEDGVWDPRWRRCSRKTTDHDCVMGLVSARVATCVRSYGPESDEGAGILAGMLCIVDPAVWRSVSKALLIGVSSTLCWLC